MLFYIRIVVLVLLSTSPCFASKKAATMRDFTPREIAELTKQKDAMLAKTDEMLYRNPWLLTLPGLEALYKVLPDQSLELVEGEYKHEHMVIWNDLRMLSKESLHPYISAFAVHNRPRYISHGLTGASGVSAAFFMATAENKVGFAVYNGADSARHFVPWWYGIMIHEIGHLFLDTPHGMDAHGTRCAKRPLKADRFVAEFHFVFWANCGLKDRLRLLEPKDTAPHFVTDYAGSNIAEDLAETWTSFVVCHKPFFDAHSPLYGKGVRVSSRPHVERKVTHMWTSPALVEKRAYIRERLGEGTMTEIEKYNPEYCSW